MHNEIHDPANMLPISPERYADLLSKEKELQALQAAGVDNWEGYDYAMELLNAEET